MIKSFISEREKHRYYNSLSEEQKYDAFNDILFESEHVAGGGFGSTAGAHVPWQTSCDHQQGQNKDGRRGGPGVP